MRKLIKLTLRFKIEKWRKWSTIRKTGVGVPQFIKKWMNASLQLQSHNIIIVKQFYKREK